MGETSKCDKTGVPIGMHISRCDLDNSGATAEGRGEGNMDRDGRDDLEVMCLHHKQLSLVLHHLAQFPAWINKGEGGGDSNPGRKFGTTDRRAVP